MRDRLVIWAAFDELDKFDRLDTLEAKGKKWRHVPPSGRAMSPSALAMLATSCVG